MNFVSVSDKIVLSALKNIKFGRISLTNYDGKNIVLGQNDSKLSANLIIKKPGFTFDIINKGSIGLAESYMRGDIETDNLTDLIEIAAKNINTVYKFSGVLDFAPVNFVKNLIARNT